MGFGIRRRSLIESMWDGFERAKVVLGVGWWVLVRNKSLDSGNGQ
jgi:hypothetical protein